MTVGAGVAARAAYKATKGAKAVDNTADAVKAADGVVDATKNRVSLRKGTKEKIKADANKTPSGDYIDPNTGQIIPKDGSYDIGHKTGQEWKTRKKMHQ